MPSIVINEKDATRATGVASTTDVVFIPGFCNKNWNCFIFTGADKTPGTRIGTAVTETATLHDRVVVTGEASRKKLQSPMFAYNATDKKLFSYTESGWTQCLEDAKGNTAPAPENTPTLCVDKSEFDSQFGIDPAKFDVASLDAGVANWDIEGREYRAYPLASGQATGEKGFPLSLFGLTQYPTDPDNPWKDRPVMYALGEYDKSFIMARDMVASGLPVIYEAYMDRDTNGAPKFHKIIDFYEYLMGDKSPYTHDEKLADKGEFTVKYITSGGYPAYEYDASSLTTSMVKCASTRGDAVAIIDALPIYDRPLGVKNANSVFYKVSKGENIPASDDELKYATMFGPAWNYHTCVYAPSTAKTQLLPPSFAYLTALAQSIVTNANWLAISGVNRGIAPTIMSINSAERMTNSLANAYGPRDGRAMNPITDIKSYGLTIWGNRTLVGNGEGNLKATSFLNIRNLVSDIKKIAYTAAKSVMFEQETEVMWNRFKGKIMPTLDKMVHGYGLSSYNIIKASTKYNGDPLGKGEVAAVIKIYPIYAVEDFEITVVMSDEGVDVE